MLRTKAIALSIRPYKERDELCSFFTKEFGRRTIVARGTKKPLSKLGPFLHGVAILDCGFVEGKNYPVLTSIDTLYDGGGNSSAHPLTPYSLAMLDLCDWLLYEEQQDEGLWNMLLGVVVQTKEYTGTAAESVYEQWLWQLLEILGVADRQPIASHTRESLASIFVEQWGKNPFFNR
ncbi:MAG: DNA repair protein RecO [Candidatus Spechtbacteria bacterium]|nr:DNA repair protein RecO [Candidatus Spechtbacteria bacterium]